MAAWAAAIPAMAQSDPLPKYLQHRAAAQEAQRTRTSQEENWAADRQLQKEFAQMGIQWRVEDAKKAGIHPLAALGAQTQSYSPVTGQVFHDSSGSDAIREWSQNMGQGLSRAASAVQSKQQREQNELQLASMRADVEGKTLDNQIRSTQLSQMRATGPALPSPMDSPIIPGQGNAVHVKPSEVYASEQGRSGIQSGMINTMQYTREASGNISIAPSADMKQRIEDDLIGEVGWHLKNRIMPPAPNTRDYPIPEHLYRQGYRHWLWHPIKQEFIPSKNP